VGQYFIQADKQLSSPLSTTRLLIFLLFEFPDEQACNGDNVKMNDEHFISSHVTNNNVGHKELDATKTTITPTDVDASTKEQALTHQQPASSTQKPVIILLVIFVISLMSMIYIYMMFPELEE
jgi:hypothetical protein